MKSTNNSKTSQSVMENMFNSVQADIYISDAATGQLLFCNRALREKFDFGQNILRGKCWEILYGGSQRCNHCNVLQALCNPGVAYRSITKKREKNSSLYIQHADYIVDWIDGKKAHLRISNDVTEREQNLRVRENDYAQKNLIAAVATRFVSSDTLDGLFDDTVKRLGEYLGIDRVHLLGIHETKRTYTEISDYYGRGTRPYSVCTSGQQLRASNYVYMNLLDGKILVESNFKKSPMKGHFNAAKILGIESLLMLPIRIQGKLWGVLCLNDCRNPRVWSSEDIEVCSRIVDMISATIKRRNLEREMFTTQETLRTIIDHVPSGIYWKDEGLRFLGGNKTFKEYFSIDEKEMIGKTIQEIIADHSQHRKGDLDKEILFDSFLQQPDIQLIKDLYDEERWLRVTRVPVRNDFGEVNIMLGIVDDVTTQVEYDSAIEARDKEMRRTAKMAQEASRAKTDFLSRVSHEIRTPLNAVIGMLQVARDAEDPLLVEHCLGRIEAASKGLMNIINEVLDISKIEADKMELQQDAFDFEGMLSDVFDIVGVKAEAKELQLQLYVAPDIPAEVIGDRAKLSQILINLIGNAIKFTPSGGWVMLSIEVASKPKEGLVLEFKVKDSGVGIPAEQLKRLFQPFEQLETTRFAALEGTGLGLMISQRFVTLMNGTIAVKSEVGKGSVFTFTARMSLPPNTTAAPQRRQLIGQGIRVLMAGSYDDEILSCTAYLKKSGFIVDGATSSEEILNLVKQGSANKNYDVVVLHYQATGREEEAAARALINGYPGAGAILLSGTNCQMQSRMLASELSIKHVVCRPLLNRKLAGIIVAASGMPSENEEAALEIPDYSGKRLLLAEDVAFNREVIRHFLAKTNITIDEAMDGRQAVSMAQNHDYDIVFMDLQMPEMDGLEATAAIRTEEKNNGGKKHLPVIAMTAAAFNSDEKSCLEAGMDEFLSKPLNKVLVFNILAKYLGKPLMTVVYNKHYAKDTKPERSLSPSYGTQYVDARLGLSRVLDDKAFYAQLLRDFSSNGDLERSIQLWSTKREQGELLKYLHSLKGVTANFGLMPLYHTIGRLEQSLSTGSISETEFNDFTRCFAATLEEIPMVLKEISKAN